MTFETKYNKEDKLYFMNPNGVPVKDTVLGVSVFQGEIRSADGSNVVAEIPAIKYHFEGNWRYPVAETKVFKTKEALQKSLFDELD
ncbi:MAG: hypothetical protein KAI81_07775 [Candidatus Marinimicrobia bacterium]|nr:hypothetical protein [Candidatus Neomarinimicrobiota bacterium]